MAKEFYDSALNNIVKHIMKSDQVELEITLSEYQDFLDINELLNTKSEDGTSLLHFATINSDVTVIQSLLNWGAEYNDANEAYSLLHAAIYNEKESLVDFFIKEGIDVNAQDASGNTALHIASIGSNKTIIKKLIMAGGDVDTPNIHDLTPRDVSLSNTLSAEKFLTACHEIDMMGSQFDDLGEQILPSEDHDMLGVAPDQTYFGLKAESVLAL